MKYYIYKIVNTVEPNELYIGSTKNIRSRWAVHKTHVKSGCTHMLYSRMREVGVDKFTIEEIEAICDCENIKEIEEKYIKEYTEKGFKMLNMIKACRTEDERKEYQQEKYKKTFCKDLSNYKPREYKKKEKYVKGARTQVIVTNKTDGTKTIYKSLYACSVALKLNPNQVKQRCESSFTFDDLVFEYGESKKLLPPQLRKTLNSLQSSITYLGISAKTNKEQYKQMLFDKIKNHKKIQKEDKDALYEYLIDF